MIQINVLDEKEKANVGDKKLEIFDGLVSTDFQYLLLTFADLRILSLLFWRGTEGIQESSRVYEIYKEN